MLPKWPPEDLDYSEKLKENKLRQIQLDDWKKEANYDEKEMQKCIEMPGFRGVFMDSEGKIHDFRPEEGKPSFNNFMKKDVAELSSLLVNALKKQLEDLGQGNSERDKELIKELEKTLKREEKNNEKYKEMKKKIV